MPFSALQSPLNFPAKLSHLAWHKGKQEPQLVTLVEVKELVEAGSSIEALANAVGKFELYQLALREARVDITLFLAVSTQSDHGILNERIGQLAIGHFRISLMVFDPEQEEIEQ